LIVNSQLKNDSESANVPSVMRIPKQYKVMDIAALGEYLGYTPNTIRTYVARKRWTSIPKPSAQLTTGPIWYVGDVDEWREKQTK
jgi:hypothetical protein